MAAATLFLLLSIVVAPLFIMIEQHRKTNGGVLQGCSHTTILLNHKERNNVIIKSADNLRDIGFDSIVVCGVSGLLVGAQIADILNKNIVIVRKNEKRYSPFYIEGAYPGRYIVVDDLVCSGSTIRYITKNIKEEYPLSKCLGVYCYLPNHCAYSSVPECFKRDFGIEYLNPAW